MKTGLRGEYMIEVRNDAGKVTRCTDWFDNIILDQGLDRMGLTSLKFNRAMVGTGNITPAAGQTALQAPLAVSSTIPTSTSRTNSGAPLYETQHLFTFAFSQGSVVGNISEIGVGWDSTNLFSRALILDGAGSPTTISITAIDQLTVYYRLTARPNLSDTLGTVVLDSITYNYTARIARADSFMDSSSTFQSSNTFVTGMAGSSTWGVVRGPGAVLGSITSVPSGGTGVNIGASLSSYSTPAYVNGDYYRDSTITMPVNTGNVTGGIVTLWSYWYGSGAEFQWEFSPPIPKDNTKTLSLTFRTSWARI